MTEQVSKRYFVWSIAGGFGLGYALLVFAILNFVAFDRGNGYAASFFGAVLLIYATIVWLVLIYKMWAAVQDGHARTSAARAVGFLFIPILNLWWIFYAIAGFPKDYNDYLTRNGLDAPRLQPHLFVAYCVLFVLPKGIISAAAASSESQRDYEGIFISFPIVFIVSIMASRICDAINAISKPPLRKRDPLDISSHFKDRG